MYTQAPIGGTVDSFALFTSRLDCDDAGDAYVFISRTDLSPQEGIRCEGDGCNGTSGNIDVLEMRKGDMHWTTYADRDVDMYDWGGTHVGICRENRSDEFECIPNVGHVGGYRLLFCEAEDEAEELGNQELIHGLVEMAPWAKFSCFPKAKSTILHCFGCIEESGRWDRKPNTATRGVS